MRGDIQLGVTEIMKYERAMARGTEHIRKLSEEAQMEGYNAAIEHIKLHPEEFVYGASLPEYEDLDTWETYFRKSALHAFREWSNTTECYICWLAAFTGFHAINVMYKRTKRQLFNKAFDRAMKEELSLLPPEVDNDMELAAEHDISSINSNAWGWNLVYRTVLVNKRKGWAGKEGRVAVIAYGTDSERGRWYKVKPIGRNAKAKVVDADEFEAKIDHVVAEGEDQEEEDRA